MWILLITPLLCQLTLSFVPCLVMILIIIIIVGVCSLYRGIHWDNYTWAYIAHWLDHPHSFSPTTPSPPHLKQLQETSLFYFIYIWSPSTIHTQLNLLYFILPTSTLPQHTHTYCICLQSCHSLLIAKLFKGVFQCVTTVSILYFGLFNPFHYSPLPSYLPPPPIF
jgi:hypothetical protein